MTSSALARLAPGAPGPVAPPARPVLVPVPRHGVARRSRLSAPPWPATPAAALQGVLPLATGEPSEAAGPVEESQTPGLPELTAFCHRFARVVVEVIGGDRGVQQLLRWTSQEVYADLVRRTSAVQRVGGRDQRVRRLRAVVRSVHLSCPTPGVAEISVHVRHGHHSRALAGRIEQVRGRWQCTALEFG